MSFTYVTFPTVLFFLFFISRKGLFYLLSLILKPGTLLLPSPVSIIEIHRDFARALLMGAL